LLLIAALFHFSLSDSHPGKLANAVDFNIKMFHQKVGSNLVIQDILKHGSMSASKSFTVLRERLERADEAWTKAGHDQTGLSILLSYSCTHAKCTEVKNTPTCTNLNSNLPSNSLMKLVLRRTDAAEGEWILDCRQFLKVELPVKDEGVPGARTAAGSGDRRTSAQKRQAPSEENVGSGNAVEFDVDAVQAAAPVYKDEEDEPETDASAAKEDVCTNTLFNHKTKDFYNKCCIGKRDPNVTSEDGRCALDVITAKLQEAKDKTSTTTTTTTTEAPKEESDISRLGRNLDLDDVETQNNTMVYNKEAADVLFQEMSGELSGWKSKYYTCLGFFLVFFAFFLVTIAVLVYKLKKNKTDCPPVSPGASLSVPQQRPRGYSAIDGDTETERAPLTPATEQAQAFQY